MFLTRRACLSAALAVCADFALGDQTLAKQSPAFARWVAGFRARAIRRGISEATYDRVMNALIPDTSVFEQYRAQPEFTELLWQYINRRCSDWRVITGKERAREYADLLARIEKDYGVDRYIMLGLWGSTTWRCWEYSRTRWRLRWRTRSCSSTCRKAWWS